MAEFFTPQNLGTLMMLIFLQAVLGIDNLLYIAIESKRVAEEKRQFVRRTGILIAIVLRLVLLFALVHAIQYFTEPIFSINIRNVIEGSFNVHSLIELLGGGFIIYTATKEISRMLLIEEVDHAGDGPTDSKSLGKAIFWIVLMNIVFSFDSILSAIALTHVFEVMAVAVVLSGIMMIFLADKFAAFLKANRMYEVLGLFILLIVGVMLLSEGGHFAHLHLFTYIIEPMSKSTFYFAIFVLVVCDIIQTRYQKKLLAQRQQELTGSLPVFKG